MQNKLNIFIKIGLLLLAAALCLTIYNVWDNFRAGRAVNDVMQEINLGDGSQGYLENPQMDMPMQMIDGIDYVGVLEIPSQGLQLPVINTYKDSYLKYGPCRYNGSPYTDNFVLAAHNYRQHFAKLNKLSVGDAVYFLDIDGNQFCYEVAAVEVVKPDETKKIKSGSWDLTMFTCTLGGQSRYVVYCNRN